MIKIVVTIILITLSILAADKDYCSIISSTIGEDLFLITDYDSNPTLSKQLEKLDIVFNSSLMTNKKVLSKLIAGQLDEDFDSDEDEIKDKWKFVNGNGNEINPLEVISYKDSILCESFRNPIAPAIVLSSTGGAVIVATSAIRYILPGILGVLGPYLVLIHFLTIIQKIRQ